LNEKARERDRRGIGAAMKQNLETGETLPG
jgi:hypothetical protein